MTLFRIVTAAALPVLLSVLFDHLEKQPIWQAKPGWLKQTVIGLCFGALAVLATEFGIPADGAVLNVRNAAPVAAGLLFGWPAGLIAGMIGGVERWFATLWGVGDFTRLACTLGTIWAGIVGAVSRAWLLDDRKPGWFHGLAVGVTAEVLHMLMVFLTNTDDIQRAFGVVQQCALPMIAANGLSVMASVWLVSWMSGRQSATADKNEKIAQTFQRWLLMCVLAAFAVTMLFTGRFQTQLSDATTDDLLRQSIADVQKSIVEALDTALLRITRQVERDMPEDLDPARLRKLAELYQVTDINVVNEQGVIIASSYEPFIGYDMGAGAQSAEFLSLLAHENSYVQRYQPISLNNNILRKYAAVRSAHGFVQVGYDAQRFQNEIREQAQYAAHNRHVGRSGFVLICDENGVIVSDNQNHIGETIEALGHDESKIFPVNQRFEASIHGTPSCCMYAQAEGYYILAVLPITEAMFSRNVAVYILAFMEVIVFAALFAHIYFLIKKLIVNNIQKINHALNLITHGNLQVTVNVRSNEEFSSLSDDINTTVGALRRLIDEAEKRIDQELELARQIQLSALPSVFPPYHNRKEMELFACMFPAKEVGGDFYDFYFTDENTLSLTIADVSGKGIPAAMFMMRAKALLKGYAEAGMPLDGAYTQANLQLLENNTTHMFVTAWTGSVNLKTGRLSVVNAGHNPPLIRRKGEGFTYLKTTRGLMLAASKRKSYQQEVIQLQPGDEIFLYTDGVTEATNAHNELYGEERLLRLLNTFGDIPMEEICARVKAHVDAFVGDAPQFDDITMLGFRYMGGNHVDRNNTVSSNVTTIIKAF